MSTRFLACFLAYVLADCLLASSPASAQRDKFASPERFRFQYHERSVNDNLAVWGGNKIDFAWGYVERFDDNAHSFSERVCRSNPDDPQLFAAERVEVVSIEDGLLQYSHTIEVRVTDEDPALKTLPMARAIHERAFANSKHNGSYAYDAFEEDNKWYSALIGTEFLGITRDGPLATIQGKPQQVGGAFRFTIDNRSYRVEWNAEDAMVTSLDMRQEAPQTMRDSGDPFAAIEAPTTTSRANLSVESNDSFKWVETMNVRSQRAPYSISKTRYITELTQDVDYPFRLEFPPEDGARVVLIDSQQIEAEWHDGKIVRVFDEGIAEDIAQGTFREPIQQTSLITTLIVIIAFLALVIVYAKRQHGRA